MFTGINSRECFFGDISRELIFANLALKDFAGINFPELCLIKDFAGINFREHDLYKYFAGINL